MITIEYDKQKNITRQRDASAFFAESALLAAGACGKLRRRKRGLPDLWGGSVLSDS
ncbi:hypothetical protein KL86DES1_10880 [uncultured Desulfovibrio sp.]|uniref:Uncharacterized protein n=1 Tax=uncultured Desulfovibrio sp. TaxID=167968 RepID=A0A212L0R6_9BACT|nr:hypothetical protein KL86DES1_10880 [uncultured Desulfovibrio sp.]VZH32753.1 conserved protein of unknown function [Desulfovibrio sp. 86]